MARNDSQSQPRARIGSSPTSMSIGETESASRKVSPRPRCASIGAGRSCVPPGAAVVTEAGPG